MGTLESEQILDRYVTNRHGKVFAIKNLQGMVGAVMARYSRAETGLKETLLREFIKEDKLKLEKAFQLIERVLIAYGDDSVGELEGAHLSFEEISMLAAKIIEHRRIGGSPIEQSTRYVRYDFQDAQAGYHYYMPRGLQAENAATYRDHMDRIFKCYARMWEPLIDYLKRQKPLEQAVYDLRPMGSRFVDMKTPKQRGAFKRTYRNDIKTKACDILRAFLPLATKANVGLFGNGRYYQHLISKMLSSDLAEARELGEQALAELSKLIPHYVKRAKPLPYLIENDRAMTEMANRYFADLDTHRDAAIRLIEPDHAWIAEQWARKGQSAAAVRETIIEEQNLNFLASLVYSYARGSFVQIRERIKQLPPETRVEIEEAYYGRRMARRDRPERGIEHGYPFTFDLVTEWAVYKDLMRHRMATLQVQPLAPDLGFEMPPELAAAGIEDTGREAVSLAEALFVFLDRRAPQEKEYAMLQGHKMRWLIGMNDRALMHMLELRTAPQGHVNYRRACQEMHRQAEQRFPERARRMAFVNHEDIYWARGDSEARQRVKEAKLESL